MSTRPQLCAQQMWVFCNYILPWPILPGTLLNTTSSFITQESLPYTRETYLKNILLHYLLYSHSTSARSACTWTSSVKKNEQIIYTERGEMERNRWGPPGPPFHISLDMLSSIRVNFYMPHFVHYALCSGQSYAMDTFHTNRDRKVEWDGPLASQLHLLDERPHTNIPLEFFKTVSFMTSYNGHT